MYRELGKGLTVINEKVLNEVLWGMMWAEMWMVIGWIYNAECKYENMPRTYVGAC